jgi:hypothetical protein
MRKFIVVAMSLGMLVLGVGAAHAQKKPAAGGATASKGTITLAEVTIVGRIQRPIAAVDVARIRPHLTLSELRQPFVDRIEEAASKEPF